MNANELVKLAFILTSTTAADTTPAKQQRRSTDAQKYFEGRADIMDCFIKAAGLSREFQEWSDKQCKKA